MLFNNFKRFAATALLVVGTGFSSIAPANAGGGISVYIGSGHSGFHGGGFELAHGRHHSGPRFRGHRKHRGFCHPRKALKKAWRLGVNRPHIERIGKRRIAVTGWHHGHRAKVVFAKHTHRCKVIKTRGLY